MISRYADIVAVLRAHELQAADPGIELARIAERTGQAYSDLRAVLTGTQLFQKGERHRRTRKMVRRYIAGLKSAWPPARMLQTMEPILASLPRGKVIDVIPALADQLSGRIIAEGMGLDFDQVRQMRQQGHAVMSLWRPAPPMREYARLDAVCRQMHEAVSEQTAPGGSLSCLHTGDDADAIADLAFWLVTSGGDSVTGTFAAALDFLARDHELQDRLRQTPSLIGGFVQETLRLAGPLRRLTRRIALAPLRLGETTIAPGEGIVLNIERAHRDPDAYPAPESLDLARKGPPLLAFGGGAHACQGGDFGVLQVEMMLEALLAQVSVHPAETRGRLIAERHLRQFATLPLLLMPLDWPRITALRPAI